MATSKGKTNRSSGRSAKSPKGGGTKNRGRTADIHLGSDPRPTGSKRRGGAPVERPGSGYKPS